MAAKTYVPQGVWLICDKGTVPTQLNGIYTEHIQIFGQNVIVQEDNQFVLNFGSMGACAMSQGKPCIAQPTDWTSFAKGVTMNGHAPILEDAQLPCKLGGLMSIHMTMGDAYAALLNGEEEERGFWDKALDFGKGFGKGLWKGLKGTAEGIYDVAVWTAKHSVPYAFIDPIGHAEMLKKDKETWEALKKTAGKVGTWAYRNSMVNALTDFEDYKAAQVENAQVLDAMGKKMDSMTAEEWGDFTGQVAFEVVLEVATVGGAAALTTLKAADKGLDVVKAADKLDDLGDTAKGLEKIQDGSEIVIHDGLNEFAPQKLGDVVNDANGGIFKLDDYKLKDGQKLGDFGEEVVEDMLRKDGYETFYRVQNNSGNGVDIVAKNANGDIMKMEVKTTQQDRLWNNGDPKDIPMSKTQRELGGENYTTDRLDKAAKKDDGYKKGNSSDEAKKAQDAIKDAKADGNKIEHKKADVHVDKDGNLRDKPKSKDWEAKPPKKKN